MEGFHGMKRKQLQALCKKHGVPANLKNCEMADRLSLLLKEERETINEGQSCSMDLQEIGSANDSKVVNKNVKKVRFSPVNETFIFVGSDSDSDSDKDYTPVKKQAGRRRSTVKPLSKKQVQLVESTGEIGVSRKITDGPVRITRSKAQEGVGGDVPLVGKKRLRRGAKVATMEVNDVGVRDKPPADVVSGDNVAGVIKSQALARRGSRKTRNARGSDGVVLLEDVSEDNVTAEEGAKHERMAKPSRRNVTKEKGPAALSREMGKVEIVGRIRRSRTQLEGKASAVDSGAKAVEIQEECEKVLQLEEPLKSLGRKGSKQKSVGSQKRRVKIEILGGKGAESGKVLRRSKRNAAIEQDSEMLTGDLGKIDALGRTRRPKVQIVEKASAIDSEIETLADQEECEDGLKCPGRNASRRESIVPQKGKKVSEGPGPLLKKETRKRSRNADVEGASEVEPSVEPMNGRPRRSNRNTSMFNSSAPTVGDLGNHETAGRIKQSREILQENFCAAEEPLRRSSRNASRNNSTFISNAVDGIDDGARKVGRMKQRREPNPKEKGSVTDSENSIEKSSRCSTHDALKSDLVEAAALTCKAGEKGQQNRLSIISEDTPSSNGTSALDGPPIVDSGSSVLDIVDHQINPDSWCIKEISGKSMEEQKGSMRKSCAKKGFHFLEVSAVNSDLEKVMDTTTTIKGTLLPSPVKLHGVSTDQSTHNFAMVVNEKERVILGDVKGKLPLDYINEGNVDDQLCQLNSRVDIVEDNLVKPGPADFQNKVSNVVSSGNASPADCPLPLYQSDYKGEASNLSEMKRILQTEEPLTGENMSLRNDKQDSQSAGDDQTSVQEDQNLQDAIEIDKSIIQELVIEDHLSELRESECSNRNFKHTSETAEEISALDLFEGVEIAQAEIFVGATQIEQPTPEANLRIAETGEGTNGHSDTAATPLRPAPESQVSGNKVITNSLHISSRKKEALEEEENQPGAQSVAQSTILERSNINLVGEEEYSSYGIEIPYETICIVETSVSNAVEKMGIELDMTNENKNEEALHIGRGLPASGEELLNRGSEQNLRMDDGCLPNLDNGDGQAAKEKENEVSYENFDSCFDVTRVTCLHKFSAGGRISPIIPEETDIDRVENISTSIVGLKSSGSSKEDISPSEHTSLEDNDEQKGEGIHLRDPFMLSPNGRNAIESGVALLHEAENSVLTTVEVVDTAEEKTAARSAQTDSNYESPKDAAKEGIESASLTHFALEESQGGNKSETADVQNIMDEALSPNKVGVCSAERSAEAKMTSDFDGSKAFPLEASTAVSCQELFLEKVYDHEVGVTNRNGSLKALDHMPSSENYLGSKDISYAKGQKGELFVEQPDPVGMEENLVSSWQVKLCDHCGLELVGPENQSADSTSVENNFRESKVFENTVEMVKATSVYIRGIEKLKEREKSLVVLDRRSDAVFIDDDALQQVTSGDFGDNFVQGEVAEFDESTHDDDSCRTSAVTTDEVAHTVTMEKMDIIDAEPGGTLLTVSPVEREKPFYGSGNEFPKIDASAVCALNEVLSKDSEVLEETSSGVAQTLQVDEMKFVNQSIDGSRELDESTSIGSDTLMSMDDKPADRSGNLGTVAGDVELNDDSSEAEKKDCNDTIQFIPEETGTDLVDKELGLNDGDYDVLLDHSLEKKLVAADEAGAESIGRINDSEKVEGGAKWVEKAPVSLQLFDCSNKWEEKDTETIKSFADTSCGKPETHSSGVIASLPSVSSSHGDENGFHIFIEGNSHDAKGKEMTDDGRGDNEVSLEEERVGAQKNDGLVDGNVENSATTAQELAEEQLDGQNGAVTHAGFHGIDYLTFNEPLCRRKSNVDETEEALGFSKLDEMGISSDNTGEYADFENFCVVASDKSEVGADHTVLSPVIALPSFGITENKSSKFHVGSEISTSQKLNLILGDAEQGNANASNGAQEANMIGEHSENSAEMKEYVMTGEKDQEAAEKLLGKLQHQAHFAVSDEQISRDGGRSTVQDDTSASIQEHIDCVNCESSCVSMREVMLIEADEINGFDSVASVKRMAESTPDEAGIGCHFVEEQLHGVKDSEHDENFRVATSQAGEASMDATDDSENIKDANEWVEEAQISPNITKSGTERDEINFADVKISVDTSCGKPLMGLSCATTSLLNVSLLHGEDYGFRVYSKFVSNDSEGNMMVNEDRETKALQFNDDSHAFSSWELNLLLGDSELDEVEKSDGGDSVANPSSTTSDDTKEVTMNVVITGQIAEEQHGDYEHHMAEDVAQMIGTYLAVSDEPICDNDGGLKNQGDISAITQENVGCESDEHQFIKVEISNNSKHSEISDAAELNGCSCVTADEVMVDCGHNELKQVQNIENLGSEDIKFSVERDGYEHTVEAIEISKDVPKIDATIVEIPPASTNIVVGRDIAAEIAQTPQLKLDSPKKISPGVKLKEITSLSAEQSNSSLVKGTKYKTSLIPRTPKNLLETYNTKENVPSSKNDQIGNTTAAKTMPKRRPLEDLQNN